MQVFFDDLDENYDDIDRFDLEMWFDNKYAKKQYIMFGKVETWNVKGDNAKGHFQRIFNSLLEAIDEAVNSNGICYLKIYEANYGRLYVEVIHHDGTCAFEIRELTKRGEDRVWNSYDEYDIIPKLIKGKNYTRNVKFSRRYW